MTLPYPPLPYLPLRPPLPPIPLPALTSHPSRPGVMRDYFYISADRYDWRESKPMEGQKLTAHRKWLDCWQNLALSDLHYFPTWEKEVHDVLQETFPDLTAIFSFYSKSIGGSTTAEDAVEMTMTEFKDLVKDVNLETKDLSLIHI